MVLAGSWFVLIVAWEGRGNVLMVLVLHHLGIVVVAVGVRWWPDWEQGGGWNGH